MKYSYFALYFLIICAYHQQIYPTPTYVEKKFYEYFTLYKGTDYKENCILIDRFQSIRQTFFAAYYAIIYRKNNIPFLLSFIKQRLESFKILANDRKNKALEAIKKKYMIDDAIWEKLCADIERLKKIHNAAMEKSNTIVNTDSLDAETKKIISFLLKNNNIDPDAIAIKIINDQEIIKKNPSTLAKTKKFIEFSTATNDLIIFDTYIPSHIELYPNIHNAPLFKKISAYAHEIQHLVHHHAITENILSEYLKHYYKIEEEIFKQSEEYKQLSQANEAQAEINAAINHPHVAHCLKKLRKIDHYLNHLYEEHFFHLSTIDMLWKLYVKFQMKLNVHDELGYRKWPNNRKSNKPKTALVVKPKL